MILYTYSSKHVVYIIIGTKERESRWGIYRQFYMAFYQCEIMNELFDRKPTIHEYITKKNAKFSRKAREDKNMRKNSLKTIQSFMVLAMLLCGIVGSSISASAFKNYKHEYNVSEYGTWNIFIKKAASVSTKKQYVTNSKGYGRQEYCFFKVQAKLGTSGTTTNLMTEKQISKDSVKTACSLSNTVDKGVTCILRVTGTPAQEGQDRAYITYYY